MFDDISPINNQNIDSSEYPAFSYTPPNHGNWYKNWPIRSGIAKDEDIAILSLLDKAEIDVPAEIIKDIQAKNYSPSVKEFAEAANSQIVEKVILSKLLEMGNIHQIIRYHSQTSRRSDKWIIIPKDDSFNPEHALNIINNESLAHFNTTFPRIHPARIILKGGQDTVRSGIYSSLKLKAPERAMKPLDRDSQKRFDDALEAIQDAKSRFRADDFIVTPSPVSDSLLLLAPFESGDNFSSITQREKLTAEFLKKAHQKGEEGKGSIKLPSFGPIYEVSVLIPS